MFKRNIFRSLEGCLKYAVKLWPKSFTWKISQRCPLILLLFKTQVIFRPKWHIIAIMKTACLISYEMRILLCPSFFITLTVVTQHSALFCGFYENCASHDSSCSSCFFTHPPPVLKGLVPVLWAWHNKPTIVVYAHIQLLLSVYWTDWMDRVHCEFFWYAELRHYLILVAVCLQ